MFAEAEFSLGSAHAKALDCIRKGGMGNGGSAIAAACGSAMKKAAASGHGVSQTAVATVPPQLRHPPQLRLCHRNPPQRLRRRGHGTLAGRTEVRLRHRNPPQLRLCLPQLRLCRPQLRHPPQLRLCHRNPPQLRLCRPQLRLRRP